MEKGVPDLLITSSNLLDYDGAQFTSRVRLKWPTLPIITLVDEGDELSPENDLEIDRFVSKNKLSKLLPPALIFLLHRDSLAPGICNLLGEPEPASSCFESKR